ncbi:MAG: universal stress protein [Planctomycetes bacterium]|nr:universal stress protein [Planctomycetota bacterium]
MSYKNILVPTDFSMESKVAFEPACELAKASGGRITFITIAQEAVNLRMAVLANSAIVTPEIDEVANGLVESARKRLLEIADAFRARVPNVSVVAEEALSPARAIVEYADREKIDMIAMSPHGHGGLKRFLLGSVTERVVREAHCAVLIVRRPVA